jgi:8-oxo-dGTP pyrophosphatase MutT (NUDIX family)
MRNIETVLARLRSYSLAGQSVWDQLPLSRRAAVFVLLYANKRGKLSVMLTMRAHGMSSFSGQAAFPGGKADFYSETPYITARREAWEEVGFPIDDKVLTDRGYEIEHLTTLPAYLSRNLLVVRPVVAYLTHHSCKGEYNEIVDIPGIVDLCNYNSAEVHAVFSVPLHKFLENKSGWYSAKNVNWGGLNWNQHWFQAIRSHKHVGEPGWYSVWGLTANMVLDVARLAFGEEPSMPHRPPGKFGDEQLIEALHKHGLLPAERDRKKDLGISFVKEFGQNSPLLNSRCAM